MRMFRGSRQEFILLWCVMRIVGGQFLKLLNNELYEAPVIFWLLLFKDDRQGRVLKKIIVREIQ